MLAEIDNAEDQEIIDAMITAPEPGDLRPGDVLHRGDSDLPAPMVTKSLISAGHRYVYNTETGEECRINRSMLAAQLGKLRPDGARAFTTKKPSVAYVSGGTFKCLLHADERKPEYDAMGLPVCHKDNLTSPLQVRLHMQRKHRTSWETIEEIKKDADRQEELTFRRAMIEGNATRRKGF